MTSVQDAINSAKNQASTAAQAVAVQQPSANSVAAYQAPAQRMGLDDLNSGLSVDGFIQSKFEGLVLKSNAESAKGASLIEEALVKFTIGDGTSYDVQACEAGKYGDPAQYIKTYDGVKEVRGGSWEAAKAKALLADDKFYTYKSADLKMTLLEDLKDIKGKVLLEAGSTIGNSISATGMKNFRNLIELVKKQVLLNAEIEVKITNEPKSAKGKTWGVLQFQLIGEHVVAD